MPEIVINGVPVDFPFEPYVVQRVYMEKVIECLQKGVNGVLESPTGTGKTLSLLCASLGWLRVKKAQIQANAHLGLAALNPGQQNLLGGLAASAGTVSTSEVISGIAGCTPKIIYASRTHTQLTQALGELKRTNYAHTIRSAVLGSRDQLCIHEEVRRESNNTNKIHMCQRYVAARSCFYYNNVESKKEHPSFTNSGILDIEDLVIAGKKQKCCPYYTAKELKTNADIVFMPYNYLLDPKARKANNIELDGAIVILDEAHNIEKMCEEAASLQFRSTDIALCIDEVTKVMKDLASAQETSGFAVEGLSNAVKDFNAEDLVVIKTMFLELEQAVDEIQVSNEGTTYPGGYIFDLLAKANITVDKRNVLLEIVDKMTQYLTTSSTAAFTKQGAGLQKFSEFLTVVFNGEHRSLSHSVRACYKVHVTLEEPKNKKAKADNWLTKRTESSNRGRVINYWCFSSSFGMQLLSQQGARCILLTSGTLSPIPALVSELGIKIPVTLENGHVVTGEQVFVSVVSSGPDGTTLNSSYNTRNDPKYIASLGRTIQNFSRIIPGGLLVFFPSYPVLKKCQDEWQSMGIWPKISEQKAIFVESQSKDTFSNNMNDYYDRVAGNGETKGACFLAVCRGKVSEGLDFSDNNGRAVIITGLPYPPLKDARVMLKQKYLDDSKAKDPGGISGQMWYQLEASRAVNQAIGRVIRHRNDYGAILLCDTRFGSQSFKQQLSAWLQPHVQTFSNFGNTYKGVIDFFKKVEATMPSVVTRNHSRQREGKDIFSEGGSQSRAVAAAFAQAKSRMVVRQPIAAALSTSQITRDVLSTSNLSTSFSPSPIQDKKGGIKRKVAANEDLFSALKNSEPTSVINFDERVSVDMNLPVFTRADKSAPPRRRLLTSINMFSKQSEPSSSSSSASSSNVTATKPVLKQELIAEYWKQVKHHLSTDEYKLFIVGVKSYNSSADFQELLTVLTQLFLGKNRHENLFKEFSRFLKASHKEDYQAICNSL